MLKKISVAIALSFCALASGMEGQDNETDRTDSAEPAQNCRSIPDLRFRLQRGHGNLQVYYDRHTGGNIFLLADRHSYSDNITAQDSRELGSVLDVMQSQRADTVAPPVSSEATIMQFAQRNLRQLRDIDSELPSEIIVDFQRITPPSGNTPSPDIRLQTFRISREGGFINEATDENVQNTSLTALMFAAQFGHAETMQMLINTSIDIDNDKNLRAAFSLAVDTGDVEAVASCITKGVNINAKDSTGCTALMKVCFRGNSPIVELLLNNGAEVNCCEPQFGWTPLMMAAKKGDLQSVILLISHEADIHAENKQGQTPAVMTRSSEILGVLWEVSDFLKSAQS